MLILVSLKVFSNGVYTISTGILRALNMYLQLNSYAFISVSHNPSIHILLVNQLMNQLYQIWLEIDVEQVEGE